MSTLSELRSYCLDQLDWEFQASSNWKKRFSRMATRGLLELADQAPWAFFETEITMKAEPDVVPTLDGDTLTLVNNTSIPTPSRDPWVFETDLTIGTTDAVVWNTTRLWDGRMLELSDGTSYWTRRIRTIWTVSSTNKIRITIDKPWPHNERGNGPFKFRVYTDTYTMPPSVMRANSIKPFSTDGYREMRYVTPRRWEWWNPPQPRAEVSTGTPRKFTQRHSHLMPAPGSAPKVSEDTTPTVEWVGPEPPGKFQYRITLAHGKRDLDVSHLGLPYFDGSNATWANSTTGFTLPGNTQNRIMEPRFESAPSPESEVVSNLKLAQASGRHSIKIELPNIEYMLGFLMTGTAGASTFLRQSIGQSGFHVRIWRKRLTADFEDYADLPNRIHATADPTKMMSHLDIKDDYHLLTEVRVDSTNMGIFYDDGQITPDYLKRLDMVGAQNQISFHPAPDTEQQLHIRAVSRPPPLVHDSDPLPIDPAAMPMLVHKVLSYLYKAEGNHRAGEIEEGKYQASRAELAQTFGEGRPPGQPAYRRACRARRSRSRFYRS
jgi:hypothetical protein